jgi:hypothetical protein
LVFSSQTHRLPEVFDDRHEDRCYDYRYGTTKFSPTSRGVAIGAIAVVSQHDGSISEAAAEQKLAEELDPLSLTIAMNAADPHYFRAPLLSSD